ncbi:MAG: ABC transporter ATP-binding protein [Bacillota bacterium]
MTMESRPEPAAARSDRSPVVSVDGLVKDYVVPAPPTRRGLTASLRAVFAPEKAVRRALDGISFTVPRGQVLGFIGPNGAGKTTTIKVLTGILTPTAGTARVLGFDPQRDRYRYTYHIGLVFGQRSLLWYDIPAIESLRLYADIYEIGREAFKRRLDWFSDLLGIGEFLHVPVRKLSLGQRMRAEIAASLLHDPEVLFLDEPTLGLDAVAKERVRDFLRQVNRERGTTIFLTTHDMNDIEALSDRVLIIDQGRIIYDGAVEPLKRLDDIRVIQADLAAGADAAAVAGTLGDLRVYVVEPSWRGPANPDPPAAANPAQPNRLVLRVPRDRSLEAVGRLMAIGDLTDLNVQPPRLDAIIRRVYERGVGPG